MMEGGNPVELSKENSDSEGDLKEVSVSAATGKSYKKTIVLQGFVQQLGASVLIDSGSSDNFVSEWLALSMPNWRTLAKPVRPCLEVNIGGWNCELALGTSNSDVWMASVSMTGIGLKCRGESYHLRDLSHDSEAIRSVLSGIGSLLPRTPSFSS